MLKTFFKTALRKILKTKTHAAINILGLSIGMAGAIIIFLFVQHELSYDHFHAPADRIYRLNYDETVSRPNGRYLATTSPPMGPALVQAYPEVEKFVRLRFSDGDVMAAGEKRFFENSVIYADSTFFDVFAFPLQLGNAKTALAAPNAAVLTPAMAAKYFGNENPLGRTLEMNNELTLNVTGVLQDEPAHSHLDFDFLVSFSTFRVPTGYPVTLESWSWISFHTYLLLKEQTLPAALEQKLPEFMRIHFPERAGRFALRLQNVKDIYLGAVGHPDIASGNRALPYGLSVIGLLILLLAAVNYVNLAVTQSFERSREVGIRKVVGATRAGLMRQFLGESALLAFISLGLAMLFAAGALEVFSNAFEWQMRYESDRRFSKLVYAFSGLATFIACIGLFGLATYTSRQRTREIGPAFPFIILRKGGAKFSAREFPASWCCSPESSSRWWCSPTSWPGRWRGMR